MASPSEMISVQPTVRFFKQMTIGVEDEQYGGGIGDTTTVHLRATHCPSCMVHARAEGVRKRTLSSRCGHKGQDVEAESQMAMDLGLLVEAMVVSVQE